MSLRDRIKQRQPAEETWWLRIATVAEAGAARSALEEAESELRVAEVTGTDQERDRARQRVEATRARAAECFEPVAIQAVGETAYEALLAEHPPTADGATWGKGFGRALFLAGVQGEMDREEWLTVLADLSQGERADAYNLALAVNVRTLDPGLPKGWTPTNS